MLPCGKHTNYTYQAHNPLNAPRRFAVTVPILQIRKLKQKDGLTFV